MDKVLASCRLVMVTADVCMYTEGCWNVLDPIHLLKFDQVTKHQKNGGESILSWNKNFPWPFYSLDMKEWVCILVPQCLQNVFVNVINMKMLLFIHICWTRSKIAFGSLECDGLFQKHDHSSYNSSLHKIDAHLTFDFVFQVIPSYKYSNIRRKTQDYYDSLLEH